MVGSRFMGLALVEEGTIDVFGFNDLSLVSLLVDNGVIQGFALLRLRYRCLEGDYTTLG